MLKNFSSNMPKGIKRRWRREGDKDENMERLAANECKIFSYKTLVAATGNFNHENTCQGDFRFIYWGKLRDGREIAVDTVLDPGSECWPKDIREFIRVKELLSSLQHPNVVKLFGYCANYYILVYQYVPYSLDKLLSGPNWVEQVNWRRRYEIIKGTANGLSYLHGGSQNRIIIHRNINPSTILLDHEWKPIIGGFRRAYQLDKDKTLVNAHVDGISSQSIQYIAPEYWKDKILSAKADIYSFGVLVLELISGQRYQRYENVDLLDWAHKLYTENRCSQFRDPTLANSAVPKQVRKCIIIGLLCVQGNPRTRPDMDRVVSMLRRNHVIVEKQIGRPGFLGYGESESIDSDVSSQQPELFHDAYQAFGEAAQNQGNEFEEAVDDGAKFLDCMPVDERQIQDKPSNLNQILKKDKDPQEGHEGENLKKSTAPQNCQEFSYETLYAATDHFASQNVLGHGGYGIVYKGKWDRDTEIAVKKSSKMSEKQRKALIREVELLSSLNHPNVVKLLGYCVHGDRCLLVYEYVPNKSLDKHLFGPNGRKQDLDWTRTYSIIVSIAKGLRYLHVDAQNCIIHRDIKAGNILLDKKWVPKIADFGISRLFDEDRTHVTATDPVGTWGYMAPEYMELHHVSVKTDVYSFGVLVLELISGKRFNFMPPLPEDNAVGLLDWAYTLFKAGKTLNIMDPGLASSAVTEQVANCIKIGLRCAQGDPKLRPDMESVLSMLTLNQIQDTTIRKPGIFGYWDRSGSPSILEEEGVNLLKAFGFWFIRQGNRLGFRW